jgi:putative ABC transport system permease protein
VDESYLELSYFQVVLAALLILVNGLISLLLRLGLGRQLIIAAARAMVQLLLVGLVLKWVFAARTWYTVVALMAVITAVAGVAAVRRTERRYPGIWLDGIVSVWASSWLVTAIALGGIVQPRPWYLPQYAIPLLGMILGNTLSGISLGLDRLSEELLSHRDQVEALLTLGATRWEAALGSIRQAVRTGMIPMINTLLVVGIVSLPGMMTGQLLAGAEPIEAVKYQLVFLFLIAASTALGTVGAILLSYRRLFSSRHQFLHRQLSRRTSG